MAVKVQEVKISYNKQTWSEDGTYYRGCFTLSRELYEEFVNKKGTTNKAHFFSLMGRDYLVDWLMKRNIPFNINRAYGAGNYYIAIKD